MVPARNDAVDLEAALQLLNERSASRRQITSWVADFRKLTDDLDYTPNRPTVQPAEREFRLLADLLRCHPGAGVSSATGRTIWRMWRICRSNRLRRV